MNAAFEDESTTEVERGSAMEVTTFSAFISPLLGNDSEHYDVKRRRSLLHPFAGSLLARSFSDV